jgi:formylglycine-generating enzyme required for sulfatase activity
MHTGYGLDEQRDVPEAVVTHDEIARLIQRYRDDSPGTERAFQGAVEAREDLLSRSGILLPRDDDRAAFYHFTFQDFLAAQRLLDVKGERLIEVFCRRASRPEWRTALSFAFGSLLAKSTAPDRAVRLLSEIIAKLTPNSVRQAVVAADCLEVLAGRGAGLRTEDERSFRQYCVAAIEREVPLKERYDLGLALGRIGDPRVPPDARDPQAYLEIPPGNYPIGDDDKKAYPDYFKPFAAEAFRVAEPYRLARYPVTNGQYRLFIDDGGYRDRRWWSQDGWQWRQKEDIGEPLFWRAFQWNGPTQPVVGVSYWEAEAFSRWAGGQLPSERQWEAAARGPNGFIYPWGGDWEDGICNTIESNLRTTSPVGLFPRSRSQPFGLEEMAGNVWEWCELDREGYGVLRGGAWSLRAAVCRAAVREGSRPRSRIDDVGFRVLVCRQNSL